MPKHYKLHGTDGYIQDMLTMAVIPNNPQNKDWQKYQKWLSEGNIPDPWKTKEELEKEKYNILIQQAIQEEETKIIKQRRLNIIAKLKKQGKLPQDYEVE